MALNHVAFAAWNKIDVTNRDGDSVTALYKVGAWETLNRNYSSKDRAYHNWNHILDLLDKNEEYRDLATRPDLIAHAILWHDVVYSTRNADGTLRPDADNVRESAALFMQYSLLPEVEKSAVCAMIMATASHMDLPAAIEFYPGFYGDRALFIDYDLSGFASEEAKFDQNSKNVRHEYKWVPEKVFYPARAEVLMRFAAANPTYKTPELEDLWGEPARANLIRYAKVCLTYAAAA